MKMQRRWEFESTHREGFFWNYECLSFAFEYSDYIGHEALYRLIEEAAQGLVRGLFSNRIHTFEIRPVFAVRR